MTIKAKAGKIKACFSAAVRFSDPDERMKSQSPCTMFCALAILMMVSIGMLWLGDKLSAKEMVFTRFMAKGQATLTGQIHDASIARDQITVVMYDHQFLSQTGSAWPISYQDHADWLLRLTSDPNTRPKAVMLDITFGQDRADATLPAFRQALCKVQNEFKVAVFLAALPSPDTGKLTVRSGLGPKPGSSEPACFTLVGVDYLPDPLDGVAWDYPLTRHLANGAWQDGPAESEQKPLQPAYRSAAMAMAQDVAHIELGEEDARLALVWGLKSAPQADRPDSLSHCKPGAYNAWRYVPGVLRQFFADPPLPICPYHRTLSMAQLNELPEQALASYLAGRYVLVGAQVPAYNDFANSPIHGLIPGVHLHAMALDNLLTYQRAYKQNTGWEPPQPVGLLVAASLAVLAVFVTHVLWWRLTARLRERGPQWCKRMLAKPKPTEQGSDAIEEGRLKAIAQRGRQASLKTLGWLARMTLQTIAAMALIALLQSTFRIGMLPVVELVTMTLFAEGINYMAKLRWLLYGDIEKSDAHAAAEPPSLPDQEEHHEAHARPAV
jgi:hypothetical protein